MSFAIQEFSNIDLAATEIYDVLSGIDYTYMKPDLKLGVHHVPNQNLLISETLDFDDAYQLLLDFLRDLDSQEGVITENLDFDDNPEFSDLHYKEPKTNHNFCFTEAGEGVALLHNSDPKSNLPFVVVKRKAYHRFGPELISLLKTHLLIGVFLIAPAVFVEIIEETH